MTTVADLAHRFRPFLKCSLDHGHEPCAPCTWETFAKLTKHRAGYRQYMLQADLRKGAAGARDDINLEPDKRKQDWADGWKEQARRPDVDGPPPHVDGRPALRTGLA